MKRIVLLVILTTTCVQGGTHGYRYRHHSDNVRAAVSILHPDWSAVGVFEYGTDPVSFPYETGTSVLDKFSGRIPVIGDRDCARPDVDWYQKRGVAAWMPH